LRQSIDELFMRLKTNLSELTPYTLIKILKPAGNEMGFPIQQVSHNDVLEAVYYNMSKQAMELASLRHLLNLKHLQDSDSFTENITDDQISEFYRNSPLKKRLGVFYTPMRIAEFMVAWSIKNANTSVLDPSVGSGIFLVGAVKKLQSLGSTRPVEQVVGVDVNPLAVFITMRNLLSIESQSQPRILLTDFFNVSPQIIGRFDAVICNPPYTRHHLLDIDYKERVSQIVENETGCQVSRLSSLYVHFFLHSLSFLNDGGRIAFITPSAWLENNYGRVLRILLKQKLKLHAILLFKEDRLVFPGVLTRACITLAEKVEQKMHTLLVTLSDLPPLAELLQVLEDCFVGEFRWGRVKQVDPDLLDPDIKWTPLFGDKCHMVAGTVELGKVAKVIRGIATGANDFFLLNENEINSYGIERKFLKPVIPNARTLSSLRCLIFTRNDWDLLRKSGEKAYLFWCQNYRKKLRGTKAIKYIELGEECKYNERYLTRHRREWWWVERRNPPDAFLIYMFRTGLRGALNEARTLALNTLHCIYFYEKRFKKALLAYLNSDIATNLASFRVYGGGLYKLEPREVETLPVPDPRKLNEREIETLESLFDELDEAEREGQTDRIKKDLDVEVKRILHL
jgi:adenine-specific DNA-methyltransferase